MYTIARLKGLIELDDTKITLEEQQQANSLYSSKESRIRRNQEEEERIHQLDEAIREKKRQQRAKVFVLNIF